MEWLGLRLVVGAPYDEAAAAIELYVDPLLQVTKYNRKSAFQAVVVIRTPSGDGMGRLDGAIRPVCQSEPPDHSQDHRTA
ncbi:hypothetical protein [Actinoplanes siamensis]|uniref:Uncharacterized protein n=1 Tax=Actinoplanes siamensis TaxID=1223317 RepID=A0A919TKR4_9ACTN|nr:hypothetical protein [Actinoplanes siamensis]GIF05544.1 hypothetical protein Asi03nite_30820 [Actinoplanes siamensis]